MSLRKPTIAAMCAAVLIPVALSAQTPPTRDTTRKDSTTTTTVRTTTVSRNGVLLRQPTAFSQTRVPLQKDYGPKRDLAQERADSIANAERMQREAAERARQDSVDRANQAARDAAAALEKSRADSIARVERMRQDSINAVNAAESARRDSIARADSIALENERMRKSSGSSWHIGLAAGAANPIRDFKSVGYNSGIDVGIPIEWHRPSSVFGVRMDLGYSQFNAKDFSGIGGNNPPVTLSSNDPKVLSATLNLTAHVPLTKSRKVNVYAMGGGGVFHFRQVGSSALGGFLGNDVFDGVDEAVENNKTKLGAQAGGGIDFGFGRTSLYVESRFVNVFADRSENVQFNDFFGDNRSSSVRWVPIVLGIKVR